MKKSVGIVLGVFAVIAALMVGIGVGSYFDKDKNNNNEVDKIGENDSKSEEKVLDVNSKMVLDLYENVYDEDYGINNYSDIYGKLDSELLVKNMSEKSKLMLVFSKIDSPFIENRKCVNSKYYYDVDNGFTDKNYKCSLTGSDYTRFISLQNIKNKYNEIFGSMDNFDTSNIIVTNPGEISIFVYDKENDGYYEYSQIGDLGMSFYRERKITEAKITGSELTITEHVKYIGIDNVVNNENNVTYHFSQNTDGYYNLYKVSKKN